MNTTLNAGRMPPPLPQNAPAYARPPRNQIPLIAGLSVIIVLALVAVVVLLRIGRDDPPADASPAAGTTPATTPATADPPAAEPRPQAETIDALLDRSFASRNKLNGAIDRVTRCTGLAGALKDLQTVGEDRRSQIAEVQEADLSALPNGDSIRSTLATALQHSLDADAAYVRWAEPAVSGGCANTAARKAAFAQGRSESDEAGVAKEAFLAEWNPVATRLGLAPGRGRRSSRTLERPLGGDDRADRGGRLDHRTGAAGALGELPQTGLHPAPGLRCAVADLALDRGDLRPGVRDPGAGRGSRRAGRGPGRPARRSCAGCWCSRRRNSGCRR